MRGLTREEQAALRELASPEPARELTDAEEDVHEQLVERGLVRTWVTQEDDGWETQHWEITDDGRLALRVCTVTP